MKNLFADDSVNLAHLAISAKSAGVKKISSSDEDLKGSVDANKSEVESIGYLSSNKVIVEF